MDLPPLLLVAFIEIYKNTARFMVSCESIKVSKQLARQQKAAQPREAKSQVKYVMFADRGVLGGNKFK